MPSFRQGFAGLFFLATIIAAPAYAGAVTKGATPAGKQEAAPPAALAQTRIAVDEKTNVVRFFIDGKEAMRLDADGLHVQGNVEYGGTMTDSGRALFDERVKTMEGAAAAEGSDAR